jgi:hypothetical protein
MKKAITIYLDEDLLNRLKNVVYWKRISIGNAVEDSLFEFLSYWEDILPECKKQRESNLKPGRKI